MGWHAAGGCDVIQDGRHLGHLLGKLEIVKNRLRLEILTLNM